MAISKTIFTGGAQGLGGITELGPVGGPEAVKQLPPWKPDQICELPLLPFLSLDKNTGTNKWTVPLLKAVWDLPPLATAAFIEQARRNYPADPFLEMLTQRPESEPGAYVWARLSVILISAYGAAGKISEAQAVYENLAALARANEDNAAIALERTKGMVNLIADYSTAGKLTKAQALYDKLATLARNSKGNTEITLNLAMGAFNLITAYCEAGKLPEAQAVYDKLAALVRDNKGNTRIAQKQAKGMVNLIVAYGAAGKLPEAQSVYDSLAALAESSKGNPEIALEQTKGMVNLIAAYGTAGKLAKAQSLSDDFARLAQAGMD